MFSKLATAAAAAAVLVGAGAAQAGSTQNLSQRALGALDARWTAEAHSYQARETTPGYNARAVRALGERYALAAGPKPIADPPATVFEWQDGGIGAAAGFALARAVAGALRLRNHRNTAIPA